jgi:amino acid adenylation domain-containing protein
LLVQSFLEESARRFPGKTALICGAKRLTYAELERQACRLAHDLAAGGVARGDRVAVFLDNSPEAVVAVFAILKAGAVFLVVNPTVKREKLVYILENCRARGLVTDARKAQALEGCWSQAPHLASVWVSGEFQTDAAGPQFRPLEAALGEGNAQAPENQCIDIDLAALIYTSGSTGKPKGVMLTHLNMVSAATSITTYLENTSDDVILNVLPLSFDYGLYQVLMGFKAGGTVVLERSFTYPFVVIEKLIAEKVTGFPIVPTISAILLEMDLGKYRFPHLRYITNTAAALPVSQILRLRSLFPDVKLYSMYGLTECKRVSYLPPSQIDIRPGSVGRGMPNEEVWIVDEAGNRAGPGATGELVIRGSNVMKGYWEDPEATDKVLRPGPLAGEKVLYSGDLFRMDEEGYLYFVGRKDDIIKTRGEKVAPKEVEEILSGIEGVAEAVVLGVPDAVQGQAIQAVIRLKKGSRLTEQEVLRHCAGRLEDFMVPKFVTFRDDLPKTSTGKNNRRELARTMGAER